MEEKTPRFDRALLLHGAMRNEVLTLAEVEQYGIDCFGDPDYVQIYGMAPRDWHSAGIRLLGRTAVECTRDALANLIGLDVAAIAARMPAKGRFVVVDPFAGSCNTLYWMLKHIPNSEGVGFELDPQVFCLSKANIMALNCQIDLLHGDWEALLHARRLDADSGVIVFIAPPWGKAFDEVEGLDLRHTSPPVTHIIAGITRMHVGFNVLYATQVYEKVSPASLAEVQGLLDWSEIRTYNINAENSNHGILLGTKGWRP